MGSEIDLYSTDSARWGPVTEELLSYWMTKGPQSCQNKNCDFQHLKVITKIRRGAYQKPYSLAVSITENHYLGNGFFIHSRQAQCFVLYVGYL